MASATKSHPIPKPRPTVKVVSRSTGSNGGGFSTDQPLRRSIPGGDGFDGYVMQFVPGVPVAISGREIDACAKDLANGNLKECDISREHLLALLEQFADAERDKQISELRDTVGRLVEAIRKTGQFRQPEIDALLNG